MDVDAKIQKCERQNKRYSLYSIDRILDFVLQPLLFFEKTEHGQHAGKHNGDNIPEIIATGFERHRIHRVHAENGRKQRERKNYH